MQAVEAAPIIEQILTNADEFDIDFDLTGDWFHAQYQLGLIDAKEADHQRNNYWRKRNQEKFGWPGRGFNDYYTWLDDGHDFTVDGFVDRAYIKTRAARWAYRLSQGWYYGPYAVVSIARTDASKEAQIAGIAIIDEEGKIFPKTMTSVSGGFMLTQSFLMGLTTLMSALDKPLRGWDGGTIDIFLMIYPFLLIIWVVCLIYGVVGTKEYGFEIPHLKFDEE